MRVLLRALGLLVLLSCFVHADIGLMLGESTGKGMSRWTSAGHSAIYLSNVCADTPIHLRLCNPGEQGAVLSNYINFNEDQPYEWNAVPLSIFLYGVDDAKDRPLYATPELRGVLQERFRQKYLGPICPEGPCTDSKAHWRDVVGATFARDVYMFVASTRLDQDKAFISKFNALPNVDHYNGFTRNCADFARLVVNTYFPGAARPDHVNDFWMTSPKAISKSFTHYAVKHKLNFHVERYTQIPGSYSRSTDARKGTELVFTTKKWFFPMLLRSNELVMFTASYLLTGRFNPERELQRRPTEEVTANLIEAREAHHAHDFETASALKANAKVLRARELGTPEQWSRYQEALGELRSQASERDLLPAATEAKDFALSLDEKGDPWVDENGAIWLDFQEGDVTRRVGVSASNVTAPSSNEELAYALLLVRASAQIQSKPKNRELLPEFEQNWQLLEQAHHNLDWKIMAHELESGDVAPTSSIHGLPTGSFFLP